MARGLLPFFVASREGIKIPECLVSIPDEEVQDRKSYLVPSTRSAVSNASERLPYYRKDNELPVSCRCPSAVRQPN